MTNHIFTEDKAGHVRHTASSRALVENAGIRAMVGMMLRETAPAAGMLPEALERYQNSGEPQNTAYSLSVNSPGTSMFEYLSKHPEREKRFGLAMREWSKSSAWDIKHLINGYPWVTLDHPGATIVDVGGGYGTCSLGIANATRHFNFVVQDSAKEAIENGRRSLPEALQKRITFMEHDFFMEQTVKHANIYFFRWIFHNWSDQYAIRILKSLVPALKDGSRILLYEYEMVEGPETRWTKKLPR